MFDSELYMCVCMCIFLYVCMYICMHLCYFNVCTDGIKKELGRGGLRDANSSGQAGKGNEGDRNHQKCANILYGWSHIVLTK